MPKNNHNIKIKNSNFREEKNHELLGRKSIWLGRKSIWALKTYIEF